MWCTCASSGCYEGCVWRRGLGALHGCINLTRVPTARPRGYIWPKAPSLPWPWATRPATRPLVCRPVAGCGPGMRDGGGAAIGPGRWGPCSAWGSRGGGLTHQPSPPAPATPRLMPCLGPPLAGWRGVNVWIVFASYLCTWPNGDDIWRDGAGDTPCFSRTMRLITDCQSRRRHTDELLWPSEM